MSKLVTKQIRIKKCPLSIHTVIKTQAAAAGKTFEDWIVEILRKAANGK